MISTPKSGITPRYLGHFALVILSLGYQSRFSTSLMEKSPGSFL